MMKERVSRSGSEGPLPGLESLVAELSAGLVDIGTPAAKPKIHRAFEHLLRMFDLDRVALWELSREHSKFFLLHYRRTPGVPLPPRPSTDVSSWAAARLLRAQPVVVDDLARLPASAQSLRRTLVREGIHSYLALPLRSEGRVFGALSFSSVRRGVRWSPELIAKLQVVADIFGTALAAQRAERAWHHAEALGTSILNSLPSCVAVLDRSGMVIEVNRAWSESSPCEKHCATKIGVGHDYLASFPSSRGGCPMTLGGGAGIRQILDGARTVLDFDYDCVFADRRRWFHVTAVPLAIPEGGAVVLHTDVTDRREVERERSDLAARLLGAQEAERSRVARELHDDIAQRIALLAIRLEKLRRSPAPQGLVDELRSAARELSLDVSHLSHQLHSSYLDHLGLAAAAEQHCKELAYAHGVRIECRVAELHASPDHDVSLGLFRVLQEALRNALRHADPRRIVVELRADHTTVRLRVVDDGVGFDPRELTSDGLGLASMRERVRLLGGELAIVSARLNGTRVEASVPLRQRKPGAQPIAVADFAAAG